MSSSIPEPVAQAVQPSHARRERVRLAVSAVLGGLSVFGFAPFDAYLLPLITVGGLIVLVYTEGGARRAAAFGFAFGLGYFLAGVSWVYVSLHDFGGMPAALALLATFLFCAYLALFPAAALYLWARLRTRVWWFDALLAAAAWTLAEWLRGWLFTGFPWLALGYAQTPPSPLGGFAPLLGVFGLSFMSVLISGLLAGAWGSRRRSLQAGAGVAVIAIAGAALGAIAWSRPVGDSLSVSLLQGNIEQSIKWQPERLANSMQAYLRLARTHPADLVVLPETAIPLLFDQIPADYLQSLRGAASARGALLLGSVTTDREERYFNSAAGVSNGRVQLYHKHHLVPFGEFTPPGFRWTLSLLHIPMSDFARGATDQRPLELAGQRVAVNICYEDLFGEEIIAALPDATLLVNLSNTAWFGHSLAQPQHLQIARMRALETARPVLRATNTGMTAIVDPRGHVQAVLKPFSEEALVSRVSGYAGTTPYVRSGNVPIVVMALTVLLAAALGRRLSKRALTANGAPDRS